MRAKLGFGSEAESKLSRNWQFWSFDLRDFPTLCNLKFSYSGDFLNCLTISLTTNLRTCLFSWLLEIGSCGTLNLGQNVLNRSCVLAHNDKSVVNRLIESVNRCLVALLQLKSDLWNIKLWCLYLRVQSHFVQMINDQMHGNCWAYLRCYFHQE